MSSVELAAFAAGSLLGLAPPAVAAGRRRGVSALIYGASGAFCAVLLLTGLAALLGNGAEAKLALPFGLPWLGAHLRLDALSAFFLVVIGLGGGVTSLYAIGYGRHEHEPQRVLPFYPAFIGAMALVVLADDAFTFLISWEVMSLLSWALVLTHHRDAATREAGFVYLTMAGFGTMALLLAFGLMAGPDGGYAFEAIRAVERSPAAAAVILTLVVVGAGSKAGLAPLHVWLPLAHPAAPSHVSALMSGVMTKVAVYGFIRVVFDLLGPVAAWTSPAIIVLGAVTAVLGILFATMDGDAKRVLAYSTIENIGVIFAALGLAMAFRANGMTALAALAFSAALFHIFNHMVFKSLLFMAAGAVLTATGRRDLDGLGGLIHRMPVTAFLALVGVTAISALPPLNGFASEWLLFQAVLQSPELPQSSLQLLVPAAGGMLALAAALAAACFVRFYGVAFLGRPRSDAAAEAVDVDRFSLAAMSVLAGLCALAGIMPGAILDLISPTVNAMLGGRLPPQLGEPWLTLVPIAESRSTYSGLLVLLFITFSASVSAWLVHRYASRALRRGPAWDCGFPQADPATQYGAGSFAQPLRRVLGTTLLLAREEVDMPEPGDIRPARHSVHTTDLAWRGLYLPIAATVGALATRLNGLQFLTIRRYLSLVFLSLILLLVGLTIWN
jgi:formate hydrogenlyase subunit 3/multisubunit Na+/H+ antiporter MnhD subunit